ncbi:hypothetical protein D0T49_00385 [Paludibacter sp. 221]|uniref:hypothetical protein n=1 Tax=Paludibacter sp. 221 TaxID=2302939 RepID=UPI0013D60F08|nr:hypothetical protein [Paludibacter sp. 221]NDV45510.1 hypothetical protein [Paludibacter sp. 221]
MNKLKFQLIISALLIIVGCGLLIAGFCVPPVGKIDNSVLIAFGEILTFVGTVFGIDYSYKSKIQKNKNCDEEK